MSQVVYYVQVNTICITILILVLIGMLASGINTLRARLFHWMVVINIGYSASDLVAGALRGRTFAGARTILWIANIMYPTMMVLVGFVWILYSSAVLKGEIDAYITWIAGAFAVTIMLANFITPITGHIFYLDENNLYHRGNYIILNWVYMYICMIFPFVLMKGSKATMRDKRAIAIYPIFPFLAGVIQIMFYGVTSGQVGVTFSVMLIYVIVQLHEMDENRRKQERLEIETELAINSNEAKGRFLATMSHEIRTPINAILGMDTMILRESKESNVRGYAMDIHTASHSLLSLVNDILDFSKIESGKMEIVPVHYEFATLVRDLYNMTRVRTEEKGLELYIDVDKNIPRGLIGDDVRLRQILLNIMGNAAKYTDKGSVTLTVTGDRNEDIVSLLFSVKDTGIGIKEADISRLFVDYERVENERNRKIEGTGLGISISSKLLNMMGSELKVKSEYGEGSEFYFTIEQKISDYEPIGDFSSNIVDEAEAFSYNAAFTAPDANVLVVDDNRMNRDVFAALVKENLINIDQAGSGMEALSMIKAKEYDVVFLDHMMPDMDGLEVISAIRNDASIKQDKTVFIALTANALSGSRDFYMGAGFDDYMSKPIIPEMLENILRHYIPEEKLIVSIVSDRVSNIRTIEEEPVKEELPLVEGIDWNYATLHYRNPESLKEAVKTFYNMIPIEADDLKKYHEMLIANPEDADALSNYRIKVHAMKNEANLVGGFFLGGSAAMLEYASRDGRVEQVINTTPYFLDSWNACREKLKVLPFLANDSDKLPLAGNEETVKKLLEDLTSAMQSFDVGAADGLMNELDKYQYPDSAEADIAKLKGYVSNLDPDNVEIIVSNLLSELL